MVFLLMFGMMVVYCMRINVGVIMIIILDEEVYMKVGILEVKWNVRLIDFGKYFCKFRLFDFKNICLFYFSLVFRKIFIEKFNFKFN